MSRASTRDALRGAGAKVPEAGLVPGSAGARVGSTDGALLHFFETEFDEWIAVSYLWRTKSEGVRDYLCNRAYSLGEARLERYLGQLVALVVACPSASLKRLLCDLCASSSRLACKVSWLLGAMTEDMRGGNAAFVRTFKSQCDAAAASGHWRLSGETWKPHLLGATSPQALRMEVFQGSLRIVRELCELSGKLAAHVPAPKRTAVLRESVQSINSKVLELPFIFPLASGAGGDCVVRLVADECCVLTSREKAPYLLLMEVVGSPCAELGKRLVVEASPAEPDKAASPPPSSRVQVSLAVEAGAVLVSLCFVPEGTPAGRRHRRGTSTVFGGSWAETELRVRASSPFSTHPAWRLVPVIVKSGDDCRQELMAVQIVSTFHSIWTEAGLPIWVRPFEVLVTSSHSAFIEVITDAPSIHAIKAHLAPGKSLADHFRATHGDGTAAHRNAQRNFVESMAGYSIISYLFQLKDRHNGNLLLDSEGHVIHIDFSFMLANSPGGLNFESAPFKLTKELLEVMESDADGSPSDAFNYFKVLCIQGFLEVRKQAERILSLVDMMQGPNIPCFRGGARVVQQLRKRFLLGATEDQCVELVLSLVGDSLDAWCMRSYDQYQRVANGIL